MMECSRTDRVVARDMINVLFAVKLSFEKEETEGETASSISSFKT
jgi:hypothetical protein